MKLVKFLCLVVLVGISAAVASAGSIDPKVTINCTTKCPGVSQYAVPLHAVPLHDPPWAPPLGFSETDPLTIAFGVGNTLDYTYTGPVKTLTGNSSNCGHAGKCLWIEITDIPDADAPISASCSSNFLASACFGVYGPTFNSNGTFNEAFAFSMGTINDETYVVSEQPSINTTPEPSTMLMFLSLGPAIGFAKKRWNARQSA
ncbi:MAG TPA: PEP-CTERM sorting domain-containing protein [Candidatus Binatus sp.]|jgi:hypothetical protein|nr:PEP-CTERM sorting domain-containing protein [Candidatus Binatus sp.]